ncbi:hypothetical protein PIB30_060666 [Stylosanthes scabra]|uniref:Uncharacterized protein n=1 Tax=Stylosanthes scabra TaxID=79078 RepID=A0ABU6XIH0_9FABA|nr:hypothetical protein [Stylosanthes scabra]
MDARRSQSELASLLPPLAGSLLLPFDGSAVDNNTKGKFEIPAFANITDGLAVGIAAAEVAAGAAGGWGSYEIVLFRRCPLLSRHYGW